MCYTEAITRSCEQTRLPFNNTLKEGFHGNAGARLRWMISLTSLPHLSSGKRKPHAPLQGHVRVSQVWRLLVANSKQ